jgi:hypothetical protein
LEVRILAERWVLAMLVAVELQMGGMGESVQNALLVS